MSAAPPISQASEYSIRNREGLLSGTQAACYHCRNVYPVEEITEYTDAGDTALCPYCGIDAVLPPTCRIFLRKRKLSRHAGILVWGQGRPQSLVSKYVKEDIHQLPAQGQC